VHRISPRLSGGRSGEKTERPPDTFCQPFGLNTEVLFERRSTFRLDVRRPVDPTCVPLLMAPTDESVGGLFFFAHPGCECRNDLWLGC
jgi:hypothetical protein